MSFGTFRKSVLSEEIADRILSLIKERELQPGDKLPPERELASAMGVSRPSLREALRALAIMRVVEIRQGDGTYITSLQPKSLIAHLDFVFSLDDSTFLQLMEARKVLEPGIAAIAAERISAEQVAKLERNIATSIRDLDIHTALLQADVSLHEQIAQACCNPILERLMASVSALGRASRARTVEIPEVPEQVVRDHRAIVQALKANDPAAARKAMLQHLENVEAALYKALGDCVAQAGLPQLTSHTITSVEELEEELSMLSWNI